MLCACVQTFIYDGISFISLPFVQVKIVYAVFEDRLVEFDKVCRAAGSNRADEGEVLLALEALSSALDALVASARSA